MTTATEAPVWTETTVLDAIEPRYRKAGNGGSGEYAFLRQVRNAAGFDATRTFDAVAIHLWPSRGFTVDVIEVKVSRSDWLRELKDPAKAEAAFQLGNRFIVAAPAGVVNVGELPPGWGLLEVTPKRCRMTVTPETHRTDGKARRETFPAGFVVAMLRSAGAASLKTPDDEAVDRRVAVVRAELSQQYAEQVDRLKVDWECRAGAALALVDELHLHVRTKDHAREEARRIRQALNADRDRDALVSTLKNQRDRLDRMIAGLEGDQ